MNHLTLEQCKKLKEIGVPQNTYFGWGKFGDGEGMDMGPQYAFKGIKELVVCACPNLDELIEWLGQDFISMDMLVSGYRVRGIDHTPGAAVLFGWRVAYVEVQALTPLEAVYNLAVAIKPHHD